MFTGAKAANALKIFKWKRHAESSLTTGLLNDVPPEIELSDYHRAPSPGSVSPSGLLNGESLNAEPIADLDLFFERLYSYYREKGLWCIITKWIVELLSLAFIICFSGFFLLYVDWHGLRNAKCGMDAVESGIKPCDLSKEALHQHPLAPFTLSKAVIVGYLGIFSIYWIFCFLRFFTQLKDTLKIRQFYNNSLHVTDNEIQTIPWASVLDKVVMSQSSQQLCVVKDLSAHDVVMRLMRKENYLIGMLNKGVLAFPISQWVPGAGPTVKYGPDDSYCRLMLTKTLEWTLNWCILQSMFDRNFCVRRDFISDPRTLKKRLIIVGLAMLLLSPFLVIFMLVYLFLRHAEQFYNHPSTASSRRWSNLSKWIFREFNEVEHLFKHRINSSVVDASDYLKQFPSPVLSIVAKFISFVSGGFAAILIIIAFLEESLLEGHVIFSLMSIHHVYSPGLFTMSIHLVYSPGKRVLDFTLLTHSFVSMQIFGRNLFWYAAVFGTITAISRAAVSDELLVLNPEGAMSLVVQRTHYMPKRWRGREYTETVRMEFETLFQYTGMMLLEEMASIFLTPYLLVFVVPKRVEEILQFIADFTVDVEGVGHVCSFSVFDFQKHGNRNYGSPCNSSRTQRSSQGKMEKSFLSFQSSYPSWQSNAQGKQFLSTLKTFREQKLQGQGTRPAYLPPRMQQWAPNLRGQYEGNGFFSRDMPQNVPLGGYQLGSLWLIDSDQKNYPYILDWYYTSGPHHETENPRDVPSVSIDLAEGTPQDSWMPSNSRQNWGHLFEDRLLSHMEASTSAPLFRGSVLQHHDTARATSSHWWARNHPQGVEAQTSFLEPPNFNQNATDNYFDNFSERSWEEQEHHLDWRSSSYRLSQTFYMDDLGEGEFDLPFGDIYSRHPPKSPAKNPDPTSLA
ncbi:hypothetical protein RJ639_011499 [Escallonia herrerae]|uniref:Autophagy-related protein 9 n=1 Tax=Escallonia herrerae TaxID=1293975 RepID=A0AA89AQ10_9ASTE|nr:hypothetical protein RJ639_011499 [Escallonia herrerae]